MDTDHTRHEIVKCVVVGDTAVGKTRLICARACNAYLTLSQTFSTHIPTVWAIDQYRIHKEVLRRSWKVVDGVNVSLRLWDTFGDPEKDRRFAYGRSDVVVLCYSVSNRMSLKNCKTRWFHEIRQFCPHVPILLVGCKTDLRHMFRDEAFLDLCREKGTYIRILREDDIATREQGRQVADEIGAEYYESSSLTMYGVEEVFENAMRLALISRRNSRFWVKNLKHVRSPRVQKPYCPPKPSAPKLEIPKSTYHTDIVSLLEHKYFTDVKLIAGQKEFEANKVILAAGSSYFHQIFISSLVVGRSEGKEEEVVTTFQWLSPTSMNYLIKFLYSGTVDRNIMEVNQSELTEASEIANIAELKIVLQSLQNEYDYSYVEDHTYELKVKTNLGKICSQTAVFSDVTFELDDGNCSAERSLLMARSDFMAALFGGFFKESGAKVVSLPGVNLQTFKAFLYYIYTDCIHDSINIENCLDILEFANRLCMPALVALVESYVKNQMVEKTAKGIDLTENYVKLLEPCQIHNAHQLAEYCQYYIVTNYQDIMHTSSKLLRSLHPENQAYLNINRWPPVYYLKEYEFYERCVRDQEHRTKPPRAFHWKRSSRNTNGCLWFWGRDRNSASRSSSSHTST